MKHGISKGMEDYRRTNVKHDLLGRARRYYFDEEEEPLSDWITFKNFNPLEKGKRAIRRLYIEKWNDKNHKLYSYRFESSHQAATLKDIAHCIKSFNVYDTETYKRYKRRIQSVSNVYTNKRKENREKRRKDFICLHYYHDNKPEQSGFIINHKKLKRKGENDMSFTTTLRRGPISHLEYIKEQLIEMGMEWAKVTVKERMGKEFYYRNSDVAETLAEEFIQKYDKRFTRHATKLYNNPAHKYSIEDTKFLIRLDKRTFLYVAAGREIQNLEERYFMSGNLSSNDLYLYVFGKNVRKYVRIIRKLEKKVLNNTELGIFIVDKENSSYGGHDGGKSINIVFQKLQPRNLDTIFFSNHEVDMVCDHINRFNENKEFYATKQLLYKTGILLYGEPGTGKSSLVKALATTYNRNIVTINVANIVNIDLNKLTQSINIDENKQYLVLLEDIDTLFLNREDGESSKEDQAVINVLLQFLDSNTSPSNVIFVATTNHIERLDDALLREGRFDLKVNVRPLQRKEAIIFGLSFGLTKTQIEEILDDLTKEFGVTEYNQSRLQARILAKRENKSLEQIISMYGEMEDSSEKKTEKKEEEDDDDDNEEMHMRCFVD